MTFIDKLAWVCLKEKKVLGARSRGREVYYLPGGKREPGESDHEGLMREIREELSVSLNPDTLKRLHVMRGQAHGKAPGVEVQLTCYTGEWFGNIHPNAEIEAIEWLAFADRDRCSETMQILLDWLKAQGLID
jgi:8-oxo-dGTP diphosphatase